MSYNPLIPEPTESPYTSASPIQVNFAQFASIFSNPLGGVTYNHVALNNPNQGKHAAVLMQNQSVDPPVINTLDVIYPKNATSKVSTEPQLFLKIPEFLPIPQDGNKPGNLPMQLTYNSVGTAGPIYYSFLPGGYLLYFGSVTALGFITLSPVPTTILMAIAIPNNITAGLPNTVSTEIAANNTGFTIYSNAVGVFSFTWMAVAVA